MHMQPTSNATPKTTRLFTLSHIRVFDMVGKSSFRGTLVCALHKGREARRESSTSRHSHQVGCERTAQRPSTVRHVECLRVDCHKLKLLAQPPQFGCMGV